MSENTAIIIPTFNSAKTIIKLLTEITKKEKDAQIFIVDDNSPDGTAALIYASFSINKNIHVIMRSKKSGRGGAVIHGFEKALLQKGLMFFIEMDSDLCHNPKYINIFLEKMKNNRCDVVVASRYLPSSQIQNWSFKRRILSYIANMTIRLILNLPLTDATNGYRCYSRKALESIHLTTISSKGFIVLSEIAYNLKKAGNSFCEIAIEFKNHEVNASNMSKKEIKEAIITLLRLRLGR